MTRLAFALLAAALLLGACGKADSLSTAPIEKDIQQGLTRQTRVRIASVTCPGKVKLEKGGTFICTASYAGGGRGRVKVTQEDANGNVRWRLVQG